MTTSGDLCSTGDEAFTSTGTLSCIVLPLIWLWFSSVILAGGGGGARRFLIALAIERVEVEEVFLRLLMVEALERLDTDTDNLLPSRLFLLGVDVLICGGIPLRLMSLPVLIMEIEVRMFRFWFASSFRLPFDICVGGGLGACRFLVTSS